MVSFPSMMAIAGGSPSAGMVQWDTGWHLIERQAVFQIHGSVGATGVPAGSMSYCVTEPAAHVTFFCKVEQAAGRVMCKETSQTATPPPQRRLSFLHPHPSQSPSVQQSRCQYCNENAIFSLFLAELACCLKAAASLPIPAVVVPIVEPGQLLYPGQSEQQQQQQQLGISQ